MRLIDADALKEQVKNEVCEVCFTSPDERQCSPNCKLCTFKELIDNAPTVSDQDTIKELWNCRNELCLRCRKYKGSHLGACDDCRYNRENMSKYKREKGGAE